MALLEPARPISSGKGICENPELSIIFHNKAVAEEFLTPPFDQLVRIDAAKNFKVGLEGPDELAVWFMATLTRMQQNIRFLHLLKCRMEGFDQMVRQIMHKTDCI